MLGDLLDALKHIENSLDTQDDFKKDLYFLSNLFQNARFQTAVKIQNKVIAVSNYQPVCNNSYNCLLESLDILDHSKDPAAMELLQIFSSTSVQVSHFFNFIFCLCLKISFNNILHFLCHIS